ARIETTMRERPAEYRRDEALQERYRSLLDAGGDRPLPATPEPSAERAEIERVMRQEPKRYRRDEAMQARYRTILDAEEAGVRPPAKPKRGGHVAEKTEIQRIMRDEPSRYWGDRELQGRYLKLLEKEERIVNGVRNAPSRGRAPQPVEHGALIPFPVRSAWEREGGEPTAYEAYARTIREANDVLNWAADAAPEIDAGLSKLPQAVQVQALLCLSDRRTINVPPLDEKSMQEVLETAANRSLAKEWGADAPRLFAKVQERLWRVLDRLDDQNASLAFRWVRGLSARARIAVFRKLAAA
ncbi:MAG: hypothetical protein AAF968_18945, partial [Pseudomonadota bacterium]